MNIIGKEGVSIQHSLEFKMLGLISIRRRKGGQEPSKNKRRRT
jgi:hypothetical protein